MQVREFVHGNIPMLSSMIEGHGPKSLNHLDLQACQYMCRTPLDHLPNNSSIDKEAGLENDTIGTFAQTLNISANLRAVPRMNRDTERSARR